MNAGAIIIALLVMVVPGAGASTALHRPGQAGIATRLALCFGLGYAAAALTGVVLEILHALNVFTYVGLLATVTALLWGYAIRRDGLRAHAAALRDELVAEPWLTGSGLAAMLLFALMRLRFSPLLNFSMFGPWRYWQDGIEIADAGRVPHQTLQWGATYTPTVSKVILNSYQAGMSYLIGASPLPAMGALLWLVAVGLACGLWALGRELGLRYTAALLPLLVLVLVDNELHRDLDVYTAENTGRMAAVCALMLGVRALRRRSGWAEPVASGVLFAVAAGSHGIPAFVLMLGLACYAAALLLVVGERRAVVLRGLAIVGVSVLIWGSSLGLSGGDVGFQGAGGSNRYSSFPPNVDPTASLFTGHVVDRATADGHWYIAPASLTRGLVASAITRPASDLELWAVPLLAIAIALVMLFRFRDELRPLGVFVVLLASLLLGFALLFSYRYSTYIPGTFGPHRLYDYVCLLALLLVLGCLEQAVGLLSRLRAGLPATVCAVAVLATAATAAYAGAPARHGWQQNGQRAEHVTSWVDANLPCSSRLLVDRLTLGTFAAETGRVSVAEGMGPYLRPSELHTVLDLVLGAHSFFQDPSAHREFLQKQMIDYVLVLKNVRVGSMVNTLEQGVDPASFHSVPFLRLVHSDDTMDVYQVLDPARGAAPSPKNYAGFDCRT
ncbi:MAG TPA: hypothetical protein VFM47_06920 [Gaiellales bacterium]|nr:hypothetical protein [Gaiellales bacterium]